MSILSTVCNRCRGSKFQGLWNLHKLSGAVPRIGTPLLANREVDESAFTPLVRYFVDAEVDGPPANGGWADLSSIWGAFDEALRYLKIAECATGAPYVSKLGPEEVAKVHAILDRHVKPFLGKNVSR